MKYVCKHIATALLLLLCCSSVYCQVSVKANIDRNRILIGEPILLSVEAYVPLGTPFTWFMADTIPHFEVTEPFRPDTTEGIDGKKISQIFRITSFDSGRWQIPAFRVMVDGKPYFSDSITVDISFAEFDPKEDYRDIKNIEDLINPLTKYIPWVLGALTLISLGMIIYFIRKRKPVAQHTKVNVVGPSPYEEAMQALEALNRKGPPLAGEEKAYYSDLNEVFRVFIRKRFRISTLERTNEELIRQLSGLGIPKTPFTELERLLRLSDFVKFAKYKPEQKETGMNLEIMRSSIQTLEKINIDSAV